jgi:beta-glucosidase/6-phospho-beta-glucosidase/beta-galactosidase
MMSAVHFGVGTADHQCEAFDPRYPDIRDAWERNPGQIARGRATDFWNRYEEDVKLAAGLGCTMFRFSISWARVEPEPGVFNQEALDHYRKLAAIIREAGMEPMVTLLHYVWPLHVDPVDEDFPTRFRDYAVRVIGAMGKRVNWWITINEPSELVFGYLKPWWQHTYRMPPGLPLAATGHDQMENCAKLIRNLFRAHREARRAIKHAHPDAMVGANPLLLGVPAWLQRLVDWRAGRINSYEQMTGHARRISRRTQAKHALERMLGPWPRILTFLPTILASDWWDLGMSGKLAHFLCPADCVGQMDFVGFDYYWGIRTFQIEGFQRLLDAGMGRFERAPVWPAALGTMLRRYGKIYPDLPIVVVENGCVTVADGIDRADYLERHVREIEEASAAGINIAAYLVWSITSNREWGLPFSPHTDFGLYHIDLDTDPELTRQPTPASEVYRRLIASSEAAARRPATPRPAPAD